MKAKYNQYEADVAPRPDGNREVSVIDLVQVGRFVARLDIPADGGEFQRADCAPRTTSGDGAITVSDWVQAGRYVVKLDEPQYVGGPTAQERQERPFPSPLAIRTPKSEDPSTSVVEVAGGDCLLGATNEISVSLESEGDENALAFSLAFDPIGLAYISAETGPGAPGATLNVNSLESSAGRVGFALALQAGNSFATGRVEVLRLKFRSSAAGSWSLAVSDQPVPREVSDTGALPVTAAFVGGSMTVLSAPALQTAQTGANIVITWPLWATNYVLQEITGFSPDAVWTDAPGDVKPENGQNSVSIPWGSESKFFRLRRGQ